MRTAQSQVSESGPTLAEIYATLNQLVDAYSQVMATFASVVSDVQELRHDMAELRDLMRGGTADALTATGIWRAVAEAHRADAEKLRAQLAELRQ